MSSVSARRFGCALALSLVLGACSHLQQPKSSEAPTEHITAPSATPQWQGRMSLLVHSEPPQHLHASFELQGSAEQGSLALSTPLGSVVAQANWQPGQATLIQGEQTQHYASLEDMLQRTSLSATPVKALFAWLLGQADNADGWVVDLSQHDKGRIQANRQYPLPAAEIKLILETY